MGGAVVEVVKMRVWMVLSVGAAGNSTKPMIVTLWMGAPL